MGDDSIDTVISHIEMGHFVTLLTTFLRGRRSYRLAVSVRNSHTLNDNLPSARVRVFVHLTSVESLFSMTLKYGAADAEMGPLIATKLWARFNPAAPSLSEFLAPFVERLSLGAA
jgi:hypothetical protein